MVSQNLTVQRVMIVMILLRGNQMARAHRRRDSGCLPDLAIINAVANRDTLPATPGTNNWAGSWPEGRGTRLFTWMRALAPAYSDRRQLVIGSFCNTAARDKRSR